MGKNRKMMCIYFFMGILEKIRILQFANKNCNSIKDAPKKSKSLINRPIGGFFGQINT